jgi:hypothetical protein
MRDEFNKFFKIREAELTGNQHKLDVDNDGDIEGDDLADLRAGKKADEAMELPAAQLPSAVKSKLMMAIDKIKDSKLTYNQKIQVIGKVMDSLGVDKGEFNKMSSKLKGTMESSIKEESPCWKGYQQIGMKEKGGKQVPNCVPEGKMNEAVSPKDMDKIKGAVEAAKSFMSVGAELKKLGMKYTFATEPLPIYIIQPTPNNRVAIVNKKYVSKPDFVVGDIAVGVMESKSVNEGLWPKSKLPQSFQFALAPELKKNFKGIFYSIGDDIYHNDKKVLSVDGDRDSVNSIIAKLKKIVK